MRADDDSFLSTHGRFAVARASHGDAGGGKATGS